MKSRLSFYSHKVLPAIGLIVWLNSSASAQTDVDLISMIKPAAHTLSGNWAKNDEGLKVVGDGKALCVAPYDVTGAYKVNFAFTRNTGSEVVGLILPLERKQVLLEFSGWGATAHGLSRINKAPVKSDANPTAVKPGTLKNNKRYRVSVDVKPDGDALSIKVALDDESIIDWSGTYDDVDANIGLNIRSNSRFALVSSDNETTFHSLQLTHANGMGKAVELNLAEMRTGGNPQPAAASQVSDAFANATIKNVPRKGGSINLTDVAWKDVVGEIATTEFQGATVVTLQGQDDTVALLPGSVLGDGEIEVEIASDIFSGIAIRAKDTRNYDLLYFRPQNSGTEKHANTVQYVCKGKAGADWRSLRTNFPGRYESGADMKVNEWFRVRLVLKGESLTTYVNDGKDPVLVVDSMLGERNSGSIGLWGWNTRFRNFSFKPDTAD